MFENSEVADTWKHELLGGKKEFDLLIQYGFKVESQLMKDLREQNSLDNLRYLAVALARLRRAYELETNSEKLLNGFDVQGLNPWVVADFKYQMNVLEDTDDSEFIQYALTQGNEFSDPQVPEFLSFHPSASSVSAVFERLRKLLESKELLIRPGQVIEITGILGRLWKTQASRAKIPV